MVVHTRPTAGHLTKLVRSTSGACADVVVHAWRGDRSACAMDSCASLCLCVSAAVWPNAHIRLTHSRRRFRAYCACEFGGRCLLHTIPDAWMGHSVFGVCWAWLDVHRAYRRDR